MGNNKTNRNVRTLEELLPNINQDEYQPNRIPNRDTFTINNVNNTAFIFITRIKLYFIRQDFDPKWEFPRSRLILEQVIGEGEFGRVLKAQALDIPGTKGIIMKLILMYIQSIKCIYIIHIINIKLPIVYNLYCI